MGNFKCHIRITVSDEKIVVKLDFYDSDRWMFYQILRSNDFNKVYWIGWHDVKITSKFKQKYMVFQ